MAVPKILIRAGRALNNGLYRATGGRLMGIVRGMPVLLLTVRGRKTGATPRSRRTGSSTSCSDA